MAAAAPLPLASRLRRRLAGALRRLATAACVPLALAPLAVAPARAAEDAPALIRDTEIEETLHRAADPIFAAAGLNPRDVRILIIGDKDLNAFASTGSNVGMPNASQIMALNTGFLLKAKTPNEMLGVIAHETGHIAGGHVARSGETMRAGLKPMLLTMGLGVLAAIAGAPDAAMGLAGSSSYFGTLGALGYNREVEARTDQAGLNFLDKAGRSGKGLVDFFDNMRFQEAMSKARQYKYFQSHPLSSERIDALKNKAERLPHYNTPDDPEDIRLHKIMQAKLDGFINPQMSLITYKESDTSYPARYARAIAYYQLKDPDRALKLLEPLLTEQPDNPYLWELKGQILFEFARAAEAEPAQRRAVQLKPDAPLLRTNLGQTLISLNDTAKLDEGVKELKLAVAQDPDNAPAWRMLAQAYDTKGEAGDARLATAEYYYAVGAKQEARVFAMRAREQLGPASIQWRRATDIVLASNPSDQDLKDMASETGQRPRRGS